MKIQKFVEKLHIIFHDSYIPHRNRTTQFTSHPIRLIVVGGCKIEWCILHLVYWNIN